MASEDKGQALQRVRQLCERLEQTRDELADAMYGASVSGATYREIAEAAGVTRQRVSQILAERS